MLHRFWKRNWSVIVGLFLGVLTFIPMGYWLNVPNCYANVTIYEDGSWAGLELVYEDGEGWLFQDDDQVLSRNWDKQMKEFGYPPEVNGTSCTIFLEDRDDSGQEQQHESLPEGTRRA